MRVVAIIPARGGSKGVKAKNVRRVGGVPLIVRAVNSARSSTMIDRVIVSTDDSAIGTLALAAGAEVMDRPERLAGDEASSESALLDVLERLDERPDVVVFIQATSPFIEARHLDEAIARVGDGSEDVVFSARETWAFLWQLTDDGVEGVNHDAAVRPRRQDRTAHYRETGAFYVLRAEGFREARHRFFGRVGVSLVSERSAIEIDTVEELDVANAIAPLIDRPFADVVIDVDAVVTDFDGVHTDDRVLVGADGSEFVTAHRGDGLGVRLLREAGIPFLILSTEVNPVVAARAAKLKVEVMHGVADKASALATWADEQGIPLDRIAYVGNDVNDLGCLDLVGWPIAVPGSVPEVLAAARVVLRTPGGHGAVRELSDRVLRSRERADHLNWEKQWLYPSVVTK